MAPSSADSRWLDSEVPRGAAYDERFARLAATGADVHGEANLVEWLRPRHVLDAGCGTGRVAIELDRRGIDVVGVDVDEEMLGTARERAPHIEWLLGDLAELQLERRFDVVVMAGNVMCFVAPGTEGAVIANMARHLRPAGLLLAGYSLGGDAITLAQYDRFASETGLVLEQRWATWDREPFEGGGYAVSLHRSVDRGPSLDQGPSPKGTE